MKKKKRKMKKSLPCTSPKMMLERQNAELVSLINNSSEEFVCIKQQQPEKESSNKEKKKKKHSSTLRFRYQSTGLFSDRSFVNRGSYQITKLNSQYTWYHLYCHNLEPLAKKQQLRTTPGFFFSLCIMLFRINSLVAKSVLQNSPWRWGCTL